MTDTESCNTQPETVFIVFIFIQLCRKFPELFKWFKDFLGYKEHGGTIEAIPQNAAGKERISGELAMEIGMFFIACW